MSPADLVRERSWVVRSEPLRLRTTAPTAFVDLTDDLEALASLAGVGCGLVHVQTRHTTTGLVINEHEPLLLADIRERLEGWAPAERPYQHDDLTRRSVNLTPAERRNGHAHLRALLLRSSESVQVLNGRLALGRWQRVLFVDLDGPQDRQVDVMVMGQGLAHG